jgi:hypothetical protein
VLHCLKRGDVCDNAVRKGDLVDNLGSAWVRGPICRRHQLPESQDRGRLWETLEVRGRRRSPSHGWNRTRDILCRGRNRTREMTLIHLSGQSPHSPEVLLGQLIPPDGAQVAGP